MVVELAPEIDHHHSEEIKRNLDQLIERNGIKVLVFDFSKTVFMDSSGIGVIMGRYKNLKLSGGEVGLIHVNETIGKLLKLSGIYRLVKNYSDAQEAIKKLV
ncbi:MAG: anti-sigma factor antagonist [Vallitaleaceae bacterium]|nr:anti-sigma factor antagonist [Vallitaleaceae bacterium]